MKNKNEQRDVGERRTAILTLLFVLFLLLMLHGNAFADDEVIVAIIDTGVDPRHPDLREHLWKNPGESGIDDQGRDRATNQIDDDRNGYVDDVHGWNFVDSSPEFFDRHGHGTHIAGIVHAMAPRSKLMILKYFDPNLNGATTAVGNTVRAIDYATRMKARIINYSAGGPARNAGEFNALDRARLQGILVVAAAGNESANSDMHRYYPADYALPNILSVTAVDANRELLKTSNFGLETVHLAAPGETIRSTIPQGLYGVMTGTSQATAFASGTAARLLAEAPAFRDPERIKRHLIDSGILTTTLGGKTRARTVLSVERALRVHGRGEGANGTWSANSAAIDERFFMLEP